MSEVPGVEPAAVLKSAPNGLAGVGARIGSCSDRIAFQVQAHVKHAGRNQLRHTGRASTIGEMLDRAEVGEELQLESVLEFDRVQAARP